MSDPETPSGTRNDPIVSVMGEWVVGAAHQICDHDPAIGQVLIGPHELGGQALVPPGVIMNTPPEEEVPYDKHPNWRHGIWAAHPLWRDPRNGKYHRGLVWADGSERPVEVTDLTLHEANEVVRSEASHLLHFLEERTVVVAGLLWEITQPDGQGEYHMRKDESLERLEALRREATEAYGEEWVAEKIEQYFDTQ
jgi:hypothetical protein